MVKINRTVYFCAWGDLAMNNAAMTFDAGTWWLIGLLVTALIGAVVFLVKRTLFSRVDELAKEVKEIRDGTTKKVEYEKDQEKLVRDIEQIKKDYTPRSVHDRAYDEVRGDIKKITENYLTKEDFFREQAKTERKLDMILDILMKKGGADA